MRSKTETVWIKHTELNLVYRRQLSLYGWNKLDAQSRASFIQRWDFPPWKRCKTLAPKAHLAWHRIEENAFRLDF